MIDVFLDDSEVHFKPRQMVSPTSIGLTSIVTEPRARALMLWDEGLDLPDAAVVAGLLAGPCHVWHGGLSLGQAGHPEAWNVICHGRSMLSRDVDPAIESSSWKLSGRAALIRNEVIEQLGGFDPSFDTLSGAALDAGLRWNERGALLRHTPDLLKNLRAITVDPPPTPADGVRIVRRRLGTKWAAWATWRGLVNRSVGLRDLPSVLRAACDQPPTGSEVFGLSNPGGSNPDASSSESDEPRVTVLVPTVGRYPYLEPLLQQLDAQTRRPDEVVVVDQNPEGDRRDLHSIAPNLPLKVLHLLPPGQCTARNLGLRAATGSHILFLDDDDEISPDLIKRHLEVLASPEVIVSCGLVDDADTGPTPPSLRYRRQSTTFPTNNAMIRRSMLEQTGLFDPTYDRGARADHDLGMRSHLAGNLHVYDPRPQVFHHHAPVGGLRTHDARIRTRNNSRSTVVERHLRTPTDIYLGLRYHTKSQIREDLALSAFATLSGQGSKGRRLARLAVQLLLLPSTLAHNRAVYREGEELLRNRPALPTLRDPQ